ARRRLAALHHVRPGGRQRRGDQPGDPARPAAVRLRRRAARGGLRRGPGDRGAGGHDLELPDQQRGDLPRPPQAGPGAAGRLLQVRAALQRAAGGQCGGGDHGVRARPLLVGGGRRRRRGGGGLELHHHLAGRLVKTADGGSGRGILLLALGLTALRLAAAGTIHLTEDEAYYRLWAQHLQLGYLDHPQMIAWWIRAGELVAGDTPLGVRLLPALATGITTWLVGDLARRLGLSAPTAE